MQPTYGYAELKQRLLSTINAAELAGYHETAAQLKVLLRKTMSGDEVFVAEKSSSAARGSGKPDAER